MLSAAARSRPTRRDAFQTAVDARDQRFDGVFFVGITTTRIYCRPACKSRLAYDNHRRFFNSAAAAERAGFRPCLRCRPELSPGRTDVGGQLDAVSRLARLAAQRIAAGGADGHPVAELAQTHRLLLAKRLIMDTDLPMTRVAYASGFQSLRRFNAVFREQYRMPPSALRRGRARVPDGQPLRITLAYRAPLAWNVLLRSLGAEGETWRKSVEIESHHGTVIVENEPAGRHLVAEISDSLLPVLMPLIAGLRRVFDLDAEPAVIDAHLSKGGLSRLIARWPGVRVPGTLEGPVSPDAFDASDRRLQRAAGVIGTKALRAMSERWRPWRAYAAELLKLESID